MKTLEQVERELEQPAEEKVDLRTVEKSLVVQRQPSGLYAIFYQPAGGETPDILKGWYTSIPRAQQAINNYLALSKREQSG